MALSLRQLRLERFSPVLALLALLVGLFLMGTVLGTLRLATGGVLFPAGVLAGGRKDLHAQARSQRLLAARLGLGRRSGDREQGKTEDDGDGAHDVVTPWRTRRPRGRRTAEF